jgi:hypothetical protein
MDISIEKVFATFDIRLTLIPLLFVVIGVKNLSIRYFIISMNIKGYLLSKTLLIFAFRYFVWGLFLTKKISITDPECG